MQRIPIAPEWCRGASQLLVTLGVAEGQFELPAKHLRIELARRAAHPTVTHATGFRESTTPQREPPIAAGHQSARTQLVWRSSRTTTRPHVSHGPSRSPSTLPILPLHSGSFHSPQSTRPLVVVDRKGAVVYLDRLAYEYVSRRALHEAVSRQKPGSVAQHITPS